MKTVSTNKAPAAIGPYSQAQIVGGMVYTSGQIGIDPATGIVPEGVEAQAHQVFKNLTELLKAAGSDMSKVVNIDAAVARGFALIPKSIRAKCISGICLF